MKEQPYKSLMAACLFRSSANYLLPWKYGLNILLHAIDHVLFLWWSVQNHWNIDSIALLIQHFHINSSAVFLVMNPSEYGLG